jgi:hypothetical protein
MNSLICFAFLAALFYGWHAMCADANDRGQR